MINIFREEWKVYEEKYNLKKLKAAACFFRLFTFWTPQVAF